MIRVTLRDLAFRRRQFAIAVVGATLVLAMALVLSGLSGGFRAEARKTVAGFGAQHWIVRAGATGPFSSASALPGDVVREVAATPGITAAQPMILLREAVRYRSSTLHVNVLGHAVGALGQPPLSSGRAEAAPGEVVIDKRAGIGIGRTFTMAGRPFVVVGRTSGRSALGGVPDLYLSIGDARALAYGGRELETAVIADGDTRALPSDLAVVTPSTASADLLSYMSAGVKAIDNLRVFLWVVASTVIGVVMYLSTLERLRDFAVLKAIGWTSGRLFAGLAVQGIAVAITAAALAAAIANLLAPLLPLPSVIPRSAFAALPAVALGVGLLASLAGLRRAIAVDPALAFGSR